ncbi:MAG: DUF4419 domain-containing protein [Litorimonas sp.]
MIDRRHLLSTGVASAAVLRLPRSSAVVRANDSGLTTPPSITFEVDDVERGSTVLSLQPTRKAIEAILSAPDSPLESWTQSVPQLVALNAHAHPFLAAVNTAYDNHLPVVFSPDMVWLLILQGVASHVNANAESLRHHFVAHEGKVLIEIRRDRFRRGNPLNDWEGAFAEFSQKMRPYIGAQTHDLIAAPFGTTGPVEQAAMNVALMDAMQSYFVFGMHTACGFPSVTLEGSVDDWTGLQKRAADLSRFELGWWTRHLLPVLDQFVETAAGRPDRDFWCSFYKMNRGSGTEAIHGHINVLFPYLGRQRPTKQRLVDDFEVFMRQSQMLGARTEADIQAEIERFAATLKEDSGVLQDTLRRNPFLGRTDMSYDEGMSTADVATKMNSAPMIWSYFGRKLQMELLAGFIGATQDPATLALRPRIGWAVREGTG